MDLAAEWGSDFLVSYLAKNEVIGENPYLQANIFLLTL